MVEDHQSAFGVSPVVPLPFTLEQLRMDILHITLFERRVSEKLGLPRTNSNLKIAKEVDIWEASATPESLHMSYDNFAASPLALALEDQFAYAFFALIGDKSDPLTWDTVHTWVGAYLLSLSKNSLVDEWEAEGDERLKPAIARCLQTSELANARAQLETGDYFYHFSSGSNTEESKDGDGAGLSIRQVAMLAGMEELSLRSITSRKTPPVLKIQKADRRTVIEPKDAIEWLQAKGRYRPVQAGDQGRPINLIEGRYFSSEAFLSALDKHLAYIVEKSGPRSAVSRKVTALLTERKLDSLAAMDPNALADTTFLKQLAELLSLSADLLLLRLKEASLHSELQAVDDLLRIHLRAITSDKA